MPLSDNELLQQIRQGGKHAFAHLVDRYKDKAMTLAMRMLRNRGEAEEATQDAFIRAYHALGKFAGNSKFSTWFYRILYNVCLTRLAKRHEGTSTIDYADDQEYASLTSFQEIESPLEIMESADLVRNVRRVIREMPEKYGTILSMFYLQELSHSEICEVSGLPLGTVKVHLFRARAMLIDRLTNEFKKEKVFT